MKTAIIVNGELRNAQFLKTILAGYSKIIAADGGANHCLAIGIRPNLIIGDLDSIKPQTLKAFAGIPIKQFPCEKDHTDLELAIQEVVDDAHISLFCATGERVDHSLTNLYMLARYPQKVFIESEEEIVSAFDKPLTVKTYPGQVLSILPLGSPATGVTTRGLKWELSNATIDQSFMSISNVCLTDQVHIELESGTPLLFKRR